MKQKYINLVKGIIVIAVFSAALMLADRILVLKSEDGYTQMQSYYKQKDNTVDVLFLGSSKVYCQIDTGILWDEYGISSFDLGGAEAPTWNSYYFMKEAIKTQKPKVILYDATIIAYRQDVMYQPEVWTVTNNYGMKWNKNRIDQLRVNTETEDTFKRLLFPLDKMHSRYSELTRNDFIDENNSINYKGFDYRNTLVPYEAPDVSSMTESFVFEEKHETYLREMFKLARENGIPFIVMVTPYVVTPGEQGYFNYLSDICSEEGITYIDFNKMYDELQLDFATDMAENIHVNFAGSKKLTEYLGNYIVSNYELTDHRGDPKYASWDIDANINRQNRYKYDIAGITERADALNLMNNYNYVIFDINNANELTVYENGTETARLTGTGESGTICTDYETLKYSRGDNYTSIKSISEEIKVEWPWDMIIVYDKALHEVVYKNCFYRE